MDYAADKLGAKSIMAVHLAGDYGDDAAAGARVAAEKRGLTFNDVETATGQDNQAGAIEAIVSGNPDVVILSNGPTDAAVIIGQAGARGFKGRFIGTSPDLEPRSSEVARRRPRSWRSICSPGRWQPLRRRHSRPRGDARGARQRAPAERGTYRGLGAVLSAEGGVGEGGGEQGFDPRRATGRVKSLTSVDYEGMLPEGAGNYSGTPNENVFRQSEVHKPDEAAPSGVAELGAVLHRADREGVQARKALLPIDFRNQF